MKTVVKGSRLIESHRYVGCRIVYDCVFNQYRPITISGVHATIHTARRSGVGYCKECVTQ
jgi:hypothetical protein